MPGLVIVIIGIALILAASELVWRKKLLKGELQRKFVHITGGTFAAFWPWLISWRVIQIIGLLLLAGVLVNRFKKFSHFSDGVTRKSYGDIFSAVAITACAAITNEPAYFALAMLHLALADGLAAVVGSKTSKKWRYQVFGQSKTVVGTMIFWLTSLFILGAGSLLTADTIAIGSYLLILVLLPPLLTILENISIKGGDNIIVPLAVVITLQWAAAA